MTLVYYSLFVIRYSLLVIRYTMLIYFPHYLTHSLSTDTEIWSPEKGDRAHQHSPKYDTKVEVRQHSAEEETGHT